MNQNCRSLTLVWSVIVSLSFHFSRDYFKSQFWNTSHPSTQFTSLLVQSFFFLIVWCFSVLKLLYPFVDQLNFISPIDNLIKFSNICLKVNLTISNAARYNLFMISRFDINMGEQLIIFDSRCKECWTSFFLSTQESNMTRLLGTRFTSHFARPIRHNYF